MEGGMWEKKKRGTSVIITTIKILKKFFKWAGLPYPLAYLIPAKEYVKVLGFLIFRGWHHNDYTKPFGKT